ncbi:hypothetical protein N7530_008690 [Penicillium desertorum]|uniref:Uncharacterized protein n=1 Tax=Penicillium desertorum TaxID=1303715 RepID=A0A9W9WQ67_9EURO|nr:hypothetical protein N7530_008690 [Penicillium desertorum]
MGLVVFRVRGGGGPQRSWSWPFKGIATVEQSPRIGISVSVGAALGQKSGECPMREKAMSRWMKTQEMELRVIGLWRPKAWQMMVQKRCILERLMLPYQFASVLDRRARYVEIQLDEQNRWNDEIVPGMETIQGAYQEISALKEEVAMLKDEMNSLSKDSPGTGRRPGRPPQACGRVREGKARKEVGVPASSYLQQDA